MEADWKQFEDLFQKHAEAVQAYCLRRARAEDAYDAAAEVFVVAWRKRRRLPDDEQVLPWLYGIAARVLANQRRASKRQAAFLHRLLGVGEEIRNGPEEQVLFNAETREVLDALESLRPIDREIVMLIAWEELTREQAALVLGCSPEAAKKRYQRATRRLERMLGIGQDQGVRSPRYEPEAAGNE